MRCQEYGSRLYMFTCDHRGCPQLVKSQDPDETEMFQKTSRDRDVQDRDYIPACDKRIDCSLLAAGRLQVAAAAAGDGETGWLSVSEADVTWFIHIISSTHLGRRQSVRLNNVCGAKGPGGRWAAITDTARDKSTAEFHLHFKQTAAQPRALLGCTVASYHHHVVL